MADICSNRANEKRGIIFSDMVGNVEAAAGMLYGVMITAMDAGLCHNSGDGIHCDQEGCSELATITYKKLHDYCRSGHKTTPDWIKLRRFCDRHKRRGDCGMDDCDANYVLATDEELEAAK
jgi:hypothetical protein